MLTLERVQCLFEVQYLLVNYSIACRYIDRSSTENTYIENKYERRVNPVVIAKPPKPEIHRKKIMLCVWWDQKEIIYCEFLKPSQTVVICSLIEVFESSFTKEIAIYRKRKAKSYSASCQRKATICEKDSGYDWDFRLGSFSTPGVLTKLGSYWLSLVPIDGALLYLEKLR